MTRHLPILIMAAGLAVIAGYAAFLIISQPQGPGPQGGNPPISNLGDLDLGKPLTLVNQDGETISTTDFAGKYQVIYFGFTYCPDICPDTLIRVSRALEIMGPQSANVQPILITIDPERDTPEQLKLYLQNFHPSFVGLTGSPEQIADAAKAFRVHYAKAADESGSDYLMDHTSFTYVLDQQGDFVMLLPHNMTAQNIALQMAEIIRKR